MQRFAKIVNKKKKTYNNKNSFHKRHKNDIENGGNEK